MAKFKSRSRVGATPNAGRGQIGSLSGGRTVGTAQEQRLDLYLLGNTGSTAWQDLLKGIGQNSSDFAQKLASLGIGGFDPMTGPEGASWNKQLLDQLIAQLSEEDKRKYNEQRWNIENTYNSPLNQLARLMGAGVSRDAAIQMLSGSGSGSASSSLTGDAAQQIGGPSPSEIHANEVAAATGIANTVFSGFNALAGLVNLGFTAPQAIQQTAFLKAQNFLTKSQISAYQSAGKAFSILHAAGAAADAFGSVANAAGAITKLSKEGNSDAAQFIATGGLQSMVENAPFASKTIADLYHTERASSDYARSYEVAMRRELADAALTEVQVDQVAMEISKASAEIDNIISSTEYNEALTATCKALGIQYNAQTNLINAQTFAQQLENQSTQSLFDSSFDGRSYLEWRNMDVLNGIVTNAKINAKTTADEYSDAMYKQMFNSAESVAAALALAGLKSEAGLEFSSKYPKSFKLWQGLEECGYYNYLDSQVKNNTANKVSLPFGISFQTRGYMQMTDPNNLYKLDFRKPENPRGHYK